MAPPAPQAGEAADPYVRHLIRNKANYALRDEIIKLRWSDGVFIAPEEQIGGFGAIERRQCEQVFRDLLDAMTEEGQPVSSNNRSGNYAPKLFAQRPDRGGYKRPDFERAMQALFAARTITTMPYGRPSDEHAHCAHGKATFAAK